MQIKRKSGIKHIRIAGHNKTLFVIICVLLVLLIFLLILIRLEKKNQQVIGGDKDEHGCLISAGYSWCEEEERCLRQWEEYCPSLSTLEDYYNTLDYTCQADEDCVVKNIGNCCGYYPQCVNKDSNPDPSFVQTKCSEEKVSSICGYPDITECVCSLNTCESK